MSAKKSWPVSVHNANAKTLLGVTSANAIAVYCTRERMTRVLVSLRFFLSLSITFKTNGVTCDCEE